MDNYKKKYQWAGTDGELMASMFLVKQLRERITCLNLRNKWSEIDIISQRSTVYIFNEVKTRVFDPRFTVGRLTPIPMSLTDKMVVSREMMKNSRFKAYLRLSNWRIFAEEDTTEDFKTEHRINERKMFHMKRGVEMYIQKHNINDFSLRVVSVTLDYEKERSMIRYIDNVL